MSNVTPLRKPPYVLIESGRCNSSDDAALVGKWVHGVVYVDADGGELTDYIGTSRLAADQVAVGWARDVGCRIYDVGKSEPRT